jgi:hypothetical protein
VDAGVAVQLVDLGKQRGLGDVLGKLQLLTVDVCLEGFWSEWDALLFWDGRFLSYLAGSLELHAHIGR